MHAAGQGIVAAVESPKERHDRELIELLNELRVALPGVQVLFAFLLAVPFSRGWPNVTVFQKDVFFVAFLGATVSSVLLIAPSSIHRLGWRVADKERIVRVSTALTIAGLTVLAISISAVGLRVTDYIFDRGTAIVTTACVGGLFLAAWYALAIWIRARS
jgi:cation transport ATPase